MTASNYAVSHGNGDKAYLLRSGQMYLGLHAGIWDSGGRVTSAEKEVAGMRGEGWT
jgi:hypothetical protein